MKRWPLSRRIPADTSLEALIDGLNAITAKHKEDASFDDYRRTGGFVFCLFSKHFGEIWRVGDCKFRNGGEENAVFWTTEEVCAQARSMMLHSMLDGGLSIEEVMAHPDYDSIIDKLLHFESSFLCRPDNPRSFGAIIGLDVPPERIERYAAKPGRLVVTSDGYPRLCDSLAETEAVLKGLLERDPLCIGENLQCKGLGGDRLSFDDRAFIAADLMP